MNRRNAINKLNSLKHYRDLSSKNVLFIILTFQKYLKKKIKHNKKIVFKAIVFPELQNDYNEIQ